MNIYFVQFVTVGQKLYMEKPHVLALVANVFLTT